MGVLETEQQQQRSQRKRRQWPRCLRSRRVFKAIVRIAMWIVRIARIVIVVMKWLSG